MIVKISAGGKSFAGLSAYLTHDPNAQTDERVAWTHTHNLANDHVPSAVDEMYWTARNAELLKQEAGVRAGGRATGAPVKHVSLNWSPEDNPSREHMIETTEGFLRHMNWQEHQVILVAHEDKSYKHVHVMLNVVHPETGLRLDDGFEQRRAQAWALGYEREQGKVYCEQRLNNVEDREKSMPRNLWMQFQQNEREFHRAEQLLNENQEIRVSTPENIRNSEWKILKELQRDERQEFFAQGKIEFSSLRSSIYREVREEFRERWADYYKAEKNGTEADRDIRADVKARLIADQKAALEPRRDAACQELRESRDERYRDLLDRQADMRSDLRWRQDAGLDNAPFFNDLADRRDATRDTAADFRDAAQETTASGRTEEPNVRDSANAEEGDEAVVHSGRDVNAIIGGRIGGFAGSLIGSLFSDLTNLGSARPVPLSAEERADVFREAAENTLKQHQQHEKEEDDARWRERQRVSGE
jgi:hypothetical protein